MGQRILFTDRSGYLTIFKRRKKKRRMISSDSQQGLHASWVSTADPLSLQYFVDYLLSSVPTEALLLEARQLVTRNLLPDRKARKVINDWIDWAELLLRLASGGSILVNGNHAANAIEYEVGKLSELFNASPPVRLARICCENDKWRNVLSFPTLKVYDTGKIKDCAFGELKRGLVAENHNGRYRITDTAVAVKVSSLELSNKGLRITDEQVFEDAQRELAVMALLSKFEHPYVLQLLTAGKDEDGFLYMVFPLGRYSLWDKLLANQTIDGLLQYLHRVRQQIGSALHFLHSLGFAHRDVSLENILEMSDGSLRLIDYGLCANLSLVGKQEACWLPLHLDSRDDRQFVVGKLRYLAPEFFLRNSGVKTIGYDATKADIFGLGICLFVLTYRAFPYHSVYDQAGINPSLEQLMTFWNAHGEKYLEKALDAQVKEWMGMMLHMDPMKRWSAKDCQFPSETL